MDFTVYAVILSGGMALILVGMIAIGLFEKVPSKKDEEISKLLKVQDESLTLYEHSPVPYVTLNSSGNVRLQNLAAIRLFETSVDGLIGVSAKDLFIKTDDSDPTSLIASILEHRSVSELEVQIKTAKGKIRWVKVSFMVFKHGKENLLALVDITRAKEVDIAKSEFVSLATHQLRTPLSAIRWNAELLEMKLDGSMPEGAENYLSKVQRNTQRMSELINDFLSVSKLEMGTFSTNPEVIKLSDFFDSVLDEFTSQVKNNNLTIEHRYNPQDVDMFIDTRLLHIIVSNLVSNAVKYTPKDGTVHVSYDVSGSNIVIIVADTGIGIPLDDQERLFTKFYRAKNALEKQAEGTGLGLYVVKQSVQKLRGKMTMSSVENKGTTFKVTLPYRMR